MIDASSISDIVRSSVDEEIEAAFVLNSAGEVIASAYKSESSGPEQHDLSAVIVTMAWKFYENCNIIRNVLWDEDRDSLEQFFLEFQNKKICAMSAAKNCLVVLVGVVEAGAGLIKLKTASLQRGINYLLSHELSEVQQQNIGA